MPSSEINTFKVEGVVETTKTFANVIGNPSLSVNTHINRGGAFKNKQGLIGTDSADIWDCVVASTLTSIKAIRRGGTGATINAYNGNTGDFLASDFSITSADLWLDCGALQNTAVAVGDPIVIQIKSVSGGPTEVAIQLGFST